MAKFKPNMAAIKEEVPSSQRSTMNVSEVKPVKVQDLHINPSNAEFFPIEDAQRFEQLKNDIRERGIIVPLLAKRDNTLLAGHNRLKAATELGLEYVPVQYVQEQLSAEQEREFLIKDNLLRRQFTGSEWLMIYRKLYPTFDEEMLSNTERRGRPKKDEKGRLTIEKIAADTGQKPDTVRMQITREQKKPNIVRFSQHKEAHGSLVDDCKAIIQDIAKNITHTSSLSEKQVAELHKYLAKAHSLLSR